MTPSIVSLISILSGILGSNVAGLVSKNSSLGLTGNTIAGVFGSILLIKSFGRLGFDPVSITQFGRIDLPLLAVNIIVSFIGGCLAVGFIHRLKSRMAKKV